MPRTATNHTLGLVLASMLAPTLHADTLSVCPGGGCDFTSIQLAIDAANEGDVVAIAAGTYLFDETIDTLGKAITLRGTTDASGRPVTTIDAQGALQLLRCASGEGADTLLENLVLRGGAANQGGGLYCDGSAPTVVNCTFTGNLALSGAALYATRGSVPELIDCTFEGNEALYRGGAMYLVDASSPVITNCTFTGNTATDRGGGVHSMSTSAPILTGCTFTGNHADGGGGGGMHTIGSSPTLINCTFTGNSTSGEGGGLFNSSGKFFSSPVITDCVFIGNTANSGGGIQNTFTRPAISGTVACENLPDQVVGDYNDTGENCISVSCTRCDDCPADLDGDGAVGGADLTIILSDWGCIGNDCVGDLDGNGEVNGADLTIILSAWGDCED